MELVRGIVVQGMTNSKQNDIIPKDEKQSTLQASFETKPVSFFLLLRPSISSPEVTSWRLITEI